MTLWLLFMFFWLPLINPQKQDEDDEDYDDDYDEEIYDNPVELSKIPDEEKTPVG